MILSLAGFMGCGKSSVASLLGEITGCTVVDLDSYIEETTGRKIPEIFATDGEAAFRLMELEALSDVISSYDGTPMVLSLGGGTLTGAAARETVRACTICVYLKASVETLARNLEGSAPSRPLLDGAISGEALRHRIEVLLDERSPIYESAATLTISVDGKTPREVAEEVALSLGFVTYE
ncbi:MAG: shikimate kinase [Bacteroidales bacterium]|nr:shikimate kinase [Bacteroidales bacterium]